MNRTEFFCPMPFLHMPNNGCNAIKPNQISVAMHLNQRLAFMLKAPSQGRTRLSPRDTQKQTSDYEHGSLNVAMPRFYRVKEIPNRLVVACRVAPARCGTQDATHTALACEPHCTRVRTTLRSRTNLSQQFAAHLEISPPPTDTPQGQSSGGTMERL